MRWYQAWRKGGRTALAATRRLGRPVRLSKAQLARVERLLLKGPTAHGYKTDLWTLPRMASVIEQATGVSYHPGHVWRVLRGLGWSLQRPARQARERDEEAIRSWRKRSWPQLKKTLPP
jgi:transposase